MKILTTEQQQELLSLINDIKNETNAYMNSTLLGQLNFWGIELKPKRTRKVKNFIDTAVEA